MKTNIEFLEELYDKHLNFKHKLNLQKSKLIKYFNKYGSIYILKYYLIPFTKTNYNEYILSTHNLVEEFKNNITEDDIVNLIDYDNFLRNIFWHFINKFETNYVAIFYNLLQSNEDYLNFDLDWKLIDDDQSIEEIFNDGNPTNKYLYKKNLLLGKIFSNNLKNINDFDISKINVEYPNAKENIKIKLKNKKKYFRNVFRYIENLQINVNEFNDEYIIDFSKLDEHLQNFSIDMWLSKFTLGTHKAIFDHFSFKDKIFIVENLLSFPIKQEDYTRELERKRQKISLFADLFIRIIKLRNAVSHNKPIYKEKIFDEQNLSLYGETKINDYLYFLNVNKIFEARILNIIYFLGKIVYKDELKKLDKIIRKIKSKTKKFINSIKNSESKDYIIEKIGWLNFSNSLKN